jgi:hypothetical protein
MATFALIPGAGGDPWEWHLLARELVARGHYVLAVQLPAGDESAGWSEYADAVVEAIDDRGDVVLVAQSLAGFTAPLVAERIPVDLIVLLNGMIPLPGETGNVDRVLRTDRLSLPKRISRNHHKGVVPVTPVR